MSGGKHMNRREFVPGCLAASTLGMSIAAAPKPRVRLPERASIKVAFLLGVDTNVIDTAGPWEVFQDVMVMRDGMHANPFEMFTVGPEGPAVMTGGLRVIPDHSIASAPKAQVIVVPAQRAQPAALEWLRSSAAHADMIMSVCTGAYQLARAGLLDGLEATTHHDFWDDFAREFPKVRLQRGARFVDNGRIATSGGLTSGIDLALHVVARYLGDDAAAATAKYLEHGSDAWRE
jgi:transcriptional regulator GlxA family with amidase domain